MNVLKQSNFLFNLLILVFLSCSTERGPEIPETETQLFGDSLNSNKNRNIVKTFIELKDENSSDNRGYLYNLVITGDGLEEPLMYEASLDTFLPFYAELPEGDKLIEFRIYDSNGREIYKDIFRKYISNENPNRLELEINKEESQELGSLFVLGNISQNKPPVILKIDLKSECKGEKKKLKLKAMAEDPEKDELTFQWGSKSSSGQFGSFSAPFSDETFYLIPENFTGKIRISVTVFDKQGNRTTETICFKV